MIALEAPKRGAWLAALLVGSEFSWVVAWHFQDAGWMGGGLHLVGGLARALPWCAAAFVFWSAGWGSPTPSKTGPGGGPYRRGPSVSSGGSAERTVRFVTGLLVGWFGVQVACWLVPSGSFGGFSSGPFLLAIDIGVAALVTVEAAAATERSRERHAWRAAALACWALAAAGFATSLVVQANNLGLRPGSVTRFALVAVEVVCVAPMIGLLLRALRETATSHLSDRVRADRGASVLELGVMILGATALRWCLLVPDLGTPAALTFAASLCVTAVALYRSAHRLRRTVALTSSSPGPTKFEAAPDHARGSEEEE